MCDPWFSDGIYDGSWFQFPKLSDPIEKIGDRDIIYISHIHPDHYDPIFIHRYFERYGVKRIITGNHKKNYLVYKGKSDGLTIEPIDELKVGETIISIFPNDTGSIDDLDTALLVSSINKGVLNLNDCVYNQIHVDSINEYLIRNNISLELLCLGFTGAGPYPQTYYDDKEILKTKSKEKKELFFKRYLKYTKLFKSKFHLPFAGQYILGGKKHVLNEYRGVADALEVKSFDEKAIVIEDGGDGFIDLITENEINERKELYSLEMYNKYISEIKSEKMIYEKEIKLDPNSIPLNRLIPNAYKRAITLSECDYDYYHIFSIMDTEEKISKRFMVNCNKDNHEFDELFSNDLTSFSPRSEIIIDYRYFFGLLTGIYHWNNAMVGSQYFCKRVPDEVRGEAYGFLNFFSII